MVDLYGILCIPKGASHDEIRRAYRLLSKKYHPDNADTCDAVAFAAVQQAHDVLTDPESKARYDKDGTIVGGVPEGNAAAELHNYLTSLLLQALGAAHDVTQVNLVDIMLRLLQQNTAAQLDHKKAALRDRAKLENVKERLTRKKGENMLVRSLDVNIRVLNEQLEKIDAALTAMANAEKELKHYKYDYNPETRGLWGVSTA